MSFVLVVKRSLVLVSVVLVWAIFFFLPFELFFD
jgi:hypothetical protein